MSTTRATTPPAFGIELELGRAVHERGGWMVVARNPPDT